jgi:AcrR family transcriptional regulator
VSPSRPAEKIGVRAALLVALQELLLDAECSAVSVPRVVSRAGVAQGTFYNYFESLPAAIHAVGELVLAEHFRTLLRVVDGVTDPAEVVARSDRQLLMLFAHRPDVGRLVFESGEPADRFFVFEDGRQQFAATVQWGIEAGVFIVDDVDVAYSIHIGAMLGGCLDIYRGRLPVEKAPLLAGRLLRDLGVTKRKATRLISMPQQFEPWRPLPFIAKEENNHDDKPSATCPGRHTNRTGDVP